MDAKSLAPPIAMLFVTLAIALATQTSAPETGRVAIMFAPWVDAEATFMRALPDESIAIVGRGAFDNVVIVEMNEPDRQSRIFETGAWWIFDAYGFGGCFGNATIGV